MKLKPHYRRDETLREGRFRLIGQGARAMAILNNRVPRLLQRQALPCLPDARRYLAANLGEAAALVLHANS